MTDLIAAPDAGIPASTLYLPIGDPTGLLWNKVSVANLRKALDPFYRPPLTADFTNTYSGDGTNLSSLDDADIGLRILTGASVTGDVQRTLVKALPSAGAADFSMTARIGSYHPVNSASFGCFITLIEGATKKAVHAGRFNDKAPTAWRGTSGTLVGYTASISAAISYVPAVEMFIRVSYVNSTTTYTLEFSADGKAWYLLGTILAATGFTTRATHIGFGIDSSIADSRSGDFYCNYWLQNW